MNNSFYNFLVNLYLLRYNLIKKGVLTYELTYRWPTVTITSRKETYILSK